MISSYPFKQSHGIGGMDGKNASPADHRQGEPDGVRCQIIVDRQQYDHRQEIGSEMPAEPL